MVNDINCTILEGNLVRDCDMKYTQSGVAIGNISIAVNRSRKQGDQWVNEVSYFDIVLFGKTAENLKQYLTKGKSVTVKGFLKQDRWTDPQGNNRSRVSVIAEEIKLHGGNQQNGQQNGGYQQNQPMQTAPQNNAPQYYSQPQPNNNGFDYQQDMPFSEDIPF